MNLASSRWLWPAGLMMVAAASTLALQIFVFRGDSITTDENSYLFQARLLASGRTWAPPPAERQLAQFPASMINLTRERWFSRYTAGHPLALVPGVLVGYPLLAPLALSVMTVLVVYALARRWYDEPTARVAAALTALSPYFVAMHATFLSHTTGLFCFSLFLLACTHVIDSGRIGWGLVAGSSLGFLFNTRPYTAVLMTWPFLAWIAWHALRHRSARLVAPLMGLCLAAGLFLGGYFTYNKLTTGDWRMSPYSLYNPAERPGFGPVMVGNYVHTPERGIQGVRHNLRRLNHWWLGFNGSFAILLGLFFTRWRRQEVLLLGSALSLMVGYFFFYFGGIDTVGPVYYFEAALPLSLLGAHSLVTIWRRWPWRTGGIAHVRTAIAVACVTAWIAALGTFYQQRVPVWMELLASQRGLENAVTAARPQHALVFVHTSEVTWYGVRYDPLLPLDIVYLRPNAERDAVIMQQHPDRQVYRYRGRHLERVR